MINKIKICIILVVSLICSPETYARSEDVGDFPKGRTIIVGDLPADHDPSLVLRKGRTITVDFGFGINTNIKGNYGGYLCHIIKDNYDDSGKFILLPKRYTIFCLYEITEEQDKIKIFITALEMELSPRDGSTILFSDPSRIKTAIERVIIAPPPFLATAKKRYFDKRQRYIEELTQVREQVFLSPTISVELLLGVESEDRTSERGKIVFGENASGGRTVVIEGGYQVDLLVRKDMLFSAPYIHRPWMDLTGVSCGEYYVPPR